MSTIRGHAAAGAGAAQMRDGEPDGVMPVALRSKAVEVARDASSGAIAGAVSRVLTAPLDVTKIRFQLDHAATRRYNSTVWAAMRSIYGEEGLVTLWRGNLPAMILWSAYTGVQFCAYEQLRSTDFLNSQQNETISSSSSSSSSSSRYSHRSPSSYKTRRRGVRSEEDEARGGEESGREREGDGEGEGEGDGSRNRHRSGRRSQPKGMPPAVSNFAYGSIAAFTATLVTYPLDLTRTALAFQGVPKRYNSMWEFMSRTLKECGIRGLFRGVTPTVAMITPQMGVSFAVWEALKTPPPIFVASVVSESGAERRAGAAAGAGAGAGAGVSTVSWQLIAGAIAGMTAKLVMFPLDTVKKRVQTAVMVERDVAYGVLPKYAGSVHALKTVLSEEGALALFRGTVPALWKSGVSTAATYAVYEWARANTTAALGGRD